MALTPYIWLLWHTKSGKIIIYICGFVVFCVFIYVLILEYGWWCLPAAIILAVALYADIKRKRKEEDEEKRRLIEETDRLHEMAEREEQRRRKIAEKLFKESYK